MLKLLRMYDLSPRTSHTENFLRLFTFKNSPRPSTCSQGPVRSLAKTHLNHNLSIQTNPRASYSSLVQCIVSIYIRATTP